ncbi:MAG: neutral zinc metallopeptidase, partial [Umezawaea sp.]
AAPVVDRPADATVVNQTVVVSTAAESDPVPDQLVAETPEAAQVDDVTKPVAVPDNRQTGEGQAGGKPETFLTAEVMEFFAVPADESAAVPTFVPAAEAPVAKTFGVPEIFRADEPTRFLTVPEPEATWPADEPAPDAEQPEVELPEVVRDPDDAETVVFAGVLDTGELDEPLLVPSEARRPERPKNNPAVLTGVLTMILCSVLGLGLIGRIDNDKPLAGRAIAAPFTTPTIPASAEPGRPRAVQRLEDHPLLVNPKSLPEITCDLPKFGTSDEQLATYYAAGVKCLDATWGPVLKEANLPFEPPSLDAAPELSDGPCGAAPASEDAVAYYCGRNRMIYMPTGRLRENGGGDRPATHLATLAHEYGHHVQAMSGMLRAADLKIVNAGEKSPAGLEMSRRIELQANCFAGMFLAAVGGRGSISTELASRAEEDFQYAMEEPPEKNAHGSPANQGTWALNGFDANTTDACNTYSAPAAQVS